jgi:hypothetical protein
MKSKLQLEVYESDILKSFATQSKEETFNFVSKIINKYEHPTEIAQQLIIHLEELIDEYQRNEYEYELLHYTDDNGRLTGKYKQKQKKHRLNKKPAKIDPDDKYIDELPQKMT